MTATIPGTDTALFTSANGRPQTARVIVAKDFDANGNEPTVLTNGRAMSTACVPAALSAEDKAVLDLVAGITFNFTPYAGATDAGKAIAIICTTAGSATLSFVVGTMTIPVAVGLTVLPFACTNAVQASGAMTIYKLT